MRMMGWAACEASSQIQKETPSSPASSLMLPLFSLCTSLSARAAIEKTIWRYRFLSQGIQKEGRREGEKGPSFC
ncbi:hypothetical protein EYF80_021695 [Liparis tanakae]|uniref:Uncharacterized protein n=1 Tax=Liparis tanakae TaxID=230148 RepID=A0A4Z2HQY8_9TELE|nr:hypothetical protein EYF80_021695 [Liparis tanakae]